MSRFSFSPGGQRQKDRHASGSPAGSPAEEARGTGRFPFTPYPLESWFKVAFSDEVALREPKLVHYFGRDLAIARDVDGRPHIVEARCPEHRELMQELLDDRLRCTQCARTNRPGVDISTGATNCRRYDTLERNHCIYLYNDRDGEAPRFEVPHIPEIDDPAWTGYNQLHWKVRTHIQEVAENAVDLSHFAILHEYDYVPTPNYVDCVGNQLIIDVTSSRKILWMTREATLHLEYNGMGCVVARVDSPDVDLVAHLVPTPIDDEHIHLNVNIIFKKTGNRLKDWMIRTFTFRDIRRELERDIMVWESKIYFARPVLCSADGAGFGKVRSWARSFY